MEHTPPAGWYADPTMPGTMRYWDGAAWTQHVSPAPGASAVAVAPPAPRTGAGAAGKVLLALGIVIGSLMLLGLIAAVAIPIFLNQQHKAEDAQAQAAVAELGVAIATGFVEDPASDLPQLWQDTDGAVIVLYDGNWSETVAMPDGVTLGGASGGSTGFCVFVLSASGTGYQYNANSGVGVGTCGQGEDLS
ncbi:DUF2510 domain-containing protein [Demequina sp. NBRC 110054]|uniref:DUF2510 domain-containing protein n=1 Tax=Demequina sp. NBRC 110054 TaxID=1570343 RepID=UPI000A0461E1|nr:DUF2510 domain-containing protein [Demequina sp. NBRC 110054]